MSIAHARVIEYTRQNTGKALCDSGGVLGRHWQQPAPTKLIRVRTGEDWWETAITLTGLLREHAKVVEDVQAAIEAEYEADREVSNFEVGPRVMKRLGYHELARDNTYNWGNNDLDQCFVFEVWSKDEEAEWIYAEDAVVLVYAHTGADVRGGYARPVAVVFDGEYSVPIDLAVNFSWADDSTKAWCERHYNSEYPFERGETDHPESALTDVMGDLVEWQEDNEVLVLKNPHRDEDDPECEEPETLTFHPHFYL
jgi:hypothetical protein